MERTPANDPSTPPIVPSNPEASSPAPQPTRPVQGSDISLSGLAVGTRDTQSQRPVETPISLSAAEDEGPAGHFIPAKTEAVPSSPSKPLTRAERHQQEKELAIAEEEKREANRIHSTLWFPHGRQMVQYKGRTQQVLSWDHPWRALAYNDLVTERCDIPDLPQLLDGRAVASIEQVQLDPVIAISQRRHCYCDGPERYYDKKYEEQRVQRVEIFEATQQTEGVASTPLADSPTMNPEEPMEEEGSD